MSLAFIGNMDINKIVKRIVIIALLLAALPCSTYANSVHSYRFDFDLPIPADQSQGQNKGSMNDAIINIVQHHTIHDLDVGINITHTSAFDLQITLKKLSGPELVLNMYNPFTDYFAGENYTNTIFDDEALVVIEDGQAPFTGRFKPKAGSLLDVFDGQDAYGIWRLKITDIGPSDVGTLDSVELIFTTPEPASAILLVFGTILAGQFRTVARRKR